MKLGTLPKHAELCTLGEGVCAPEHRTSDAVIHILASATRAMASKPPSSEHTLTTNPAATLADDLARLSRLSRGPQEGAVVGRGGRAGQSSVGAQREEEEEAAGGAKHWRWNYHKYMLRHMELVAQDPEACLACAREGLRVMYDTFTIDGATLGRVMEGGGRPYPDDGTAPRTRMMTYTVRSLASRQGHTEGVGEAGDEPCLELPVMDPTIRGDAADGSGIKVLRGKREIYEYLRGLGLKGLVTSDVPDAVNGVSLDAHSLGEWSFVIMGAGAAMGPLSTLLALGAHVIAIDLPRPETWKRLIAFARSPECKGSLSIPVNVTPPRSSSSTASTTGARGGCSSFSSSATAADIAAGMTDDEACEFAGCDLLKQPFEISEWLLRCFPPTSFKLVMGCYAYLDSSAFTRVSVAMDAITSKVMHSRPKHTTAVAYLCSPTDIFLIPERDAVRSMEANRHIPTAHQAVKALSQRVLRPNVHPVTCADGTTKYLVDSLVLQQGPNYMFAKRLQHWRAMVSNADGYIVSSNPAPASYTLSVLKNPILAAAFKGVSFFPPMLIFDPRTSNALMTFLLLRDLQAQRVGAHRYSHPYMLFTETSVHNGIWPNPYQLRTILEVAVMIFYARSTGVSLAWLLSAGVAVAYGVVQYRAQL